MKFRDWFLPPSRKTHTPYSIYKALGILLGGVAVIITIYVSYHLYSLMLVSAWYSGPSIFTDSFGGSILRLPAYMWAFAGELMDGKKVTLVFTDGVANGDVFFAKLCG